MQDDKKHQESQNDLARREFVALSVSAGLAAAAAAPAAGAELKVVESDVTIKTPDGECDAAWIRPATGSHPGVIIWTDAFGLRPSFRDMAKRVAAEGYSVLVPNPFYRAAKSPAFTADEIAHFSFQDQTSRAKLNPLMGSINAPDAAEKDAVAFVAFLDSQKEVNKSKKIGTQGYCMGGPLVLRTAAAVPDRIGAVGSFHGGGLVTNNPNSPHLLASKIKAKKLYFGVASNDDKNQPDAKDKLKEAFGSKAEIEVYSMSQHGWCVKDMPLQNGMPIYNQPDAERAWAKLVALYKSALA